MSSIDLSDLRGQLADLKAARRSGAKRVVIGERDVTYKSDMEMVAAIRDLEKEIADNSVTPGTRRRRGRASIAIVRTGR